MKRIPDERFVNMSRYFSERPEGTAGVPLHDDRQIRSTATVWRVHRHSRIRSGPVVEGVVEPVTCRASRMSGEEGHGS